MREREGGEKERREGGKKLTLLFKKLGAVSLYFLPRPDLKALTRPTPERPTRRLSPWRQNRKGGTEGRK